MTLILSTREFVIKNCLVQFDMLKIRAPRLKGGGIKPPFCEDKPKNLTIYKSVFREDYVSLIFGSRPRVYLTLLWLGGGKCAPLVDFFNNSYRKIFIAMKLLEFLQLLIVQLLKRFH